MELIILLAIAILIMLYRNYEGQNVGRFINDQVTVLYDKFAPYSFKKVREKTKELGQELSPRQYIMQAVFLGAFAGVISYLYFYNLVVSIIYVLGAVALVPYLSFLRCKRIYSEFIFEQIQVYTSNTIMEFATTQSFVKSLEGVRESGLLDDPVAGDVDRVIELAYQNGSIDESVSYFNNLYPYYIVKNMHQLFLQITKEGAQNSQDSLEQMQLDIDTLVEGETIRNIYLCKGKRSAETRNGKPYDNLILQDKTGTLDGKVWDPNSNGIADYDEKDFIEVFGDVISYNNNLQLNIRQIRKAEEGEYNPADYMPTTDKSVDGMYEELTAYIRQI